MSKTPYMYFPPNMTPDHLVKDIKEAFRTIDSEYITNNLNFQEGGLFLNKIS